MRHSNKHKNLAVSASMIAVAAALMLVQPAFAAADTSAIQGRVTSAAAGSKVTAVNTATGEKASGTVGADGSYIIIGLRPGTYHITSGGGAQDVTLSVGETTVVDLDANAAAIVVTGRRKQVRTSEVATNVSNAQMENLPQNDRNFINFAALAPGVNISLDGERKTFQAGATSANNVNIFIDGQSQKNNVLAGGSLGQDSSRGNPFPQLAVQEFKVSTQNFKAEYEQAGSAIISAVTKTGGNEFHGSVFNVLQNKTMSGQPFYERGSPKPNYHRNQYGMDLGGPIVKDLLHFYVAFEGVDEVRPASSVIMPGVSAFIPAPLAASLATLNGTFPKGFKEELYFGKLTWTPNADNTIDLTMLNRTEGDDRDFGGTTAHSHGSTLNQFVKEGTLSWKYRGENLLNEVSLEYQSYHWRQAPLTSSPGITLVTPSFNTLANLGGATYSQEKAQENITFKNNVTLTGINWHGNHVVKLGVKLADFKYIATENDHFNPEFFYDSSTYVLGSASNVPLRVRISDGDPQVNGHNLQLGMFIQDDWTYDEHWAFNLGVRWDYESNMLNNDFVTSPGVATAIRNHVGFSAAGFNPEDYISNGHNRDPFMGAIAPRLGFSYDVNGDRQTVFFGGFGRYYDRTIYDNAQLETRRAQIHVTQIDFPQVVGNPATANWNPAYFNNPAALVGLAQSLGLKGEVFALNNNTKVPYSDQFNIGVRKQFGAIATSFTFAKIESYDIFSFVLGNRRPDGSWGAFGGSYATAPWGDGLPGYGNFIISTNEQRASYNAIYLTADKPYTKASGYGWGVKIDLNDAKQTGHNDRFVFDWESPRYTGNHPAEGVSKVNIVANGQVDIPWDMRLSGTLSLNSGAPQDQFNVGFPPADNWKLGAYFPKGGIAYKNLDMRLSKDFNLPNGNVITIDGQVFNVFDWVNRTYSVWGSGGGGLNAPWHAATHKPDNATQGSARTFQVGLKYKW